MSPSCQQSNQFPAAIHGLFQTHFPIGGFRVQLAVARLPHPPEARKEESMKKKSCSAFLTILRFSSLGFMGLPENVKRILPARPPESRPISGISRKKDSEPLSSRPGHLPYQIMPERAVSCQPVHTGQPTLCHIKPAQTRPGSHSTRHPKQ